MTCYLRLIAALLLLALTVPVQAEDEYGPTPPRLSYFKGDVAVYREQGDGWEEVRLNLPIAAGDALDTGAASSLELQLGSRAYIRADSHTRFLLAEQETRGLRIEIDSGRMAFDLREMPDDGYLIDVSVRGALLTLERPGYYRFDVDQDVRLSVRQGGQATAIPASGESLQLHSSESLWLTGDDAVHAAVGRANEPDAWDRWNLARTDELIAASSTRYLPSGVAGAHDLDRYGSWRITANYGAVWMPYAVAPGWVPYGSGHWVWDPYYQWTWIDDAPWGWAPFHYGRWIYLGNRWVWAPGPLIRRPVYSPALVAFFYYGPLPAYRTCWVALGWGEPVVPWWGRPAFHGKPSWHGWGGPRMVNRKPVQRKEAIHVGGITYANSQVNSALVAAAPDQFGRRDMQKTRLSAKNRSVLTPLLGPLPQPQALRNRAETQQTKQEGAIRRAETKAPAAGRVEAPEQRGATINAPSRERQQRELRLPYTQQRAPAAGSTPQVQADAPEPGSTGGRESQRRRSIEPGGTAAFGQPRQPYTQRSPAAEREALHPREPARVPEVQSGSDGAGEERSRQVPSRATRSTPYGLDPDYQSQRTQSRTYPQQQPGGQWGVRERQWEDRSPRSPAENQ